MPKKPHRVKASEQHDDEYSNISERYSEAGETDGSGDTDAFLDRVGTYSINSEGGGHDDTVEPPPVHVRQATGYGDDLQPSEYGSMNQGDSTDNDGGNWVNPTLDRVRELSDQIVEELRQYSEYDPARQRESATAVNALKAAMRSVERALERSQSREAQMAPTTEQAD